jgi:photosystem II stability/assembly factor-like uncharacterized protein
MRPVFPSLLSAALLLSVLLPGAGRAQGASPFDQLPFRSIGPAVHGGRLHDVEAHPNDAATVYVVGASSGVWKSTNRGITWKPIFDDQPVNTGGDLAIFAGNPDILWLGTGEQNNRQSSSWGNGMYKSMDGGNSWTHLGLDNTAAIAKVRTHPTDPDIAYVAAAGNLWKPNPERGVYKTVDGGRTWTQSLYVDTLTGATDLVMDPSDPNTLYAAMYQRLRQPWGFNGGGPGSDIYKTTDGGATWTKLTSGIPEGDKGRIGIAIAQTYPRMLLATIEHPTAGGTYRTEDGGETWTRANTTNPRPMYYSKIYIDPTNERRAYILGVTVYRSDDGGRSFQELPNSPVYDVGLKTDHHALWIDPKDPKWLYLAGDGGLHVSADMGANWRRVNNFAIGQFYAIGADDRDPYWVYGGLQDNHSFMGPSATRHWLGIVNTDWRQIGFSDGAVQQPDPFVPRWLYSSSTGMNLQRVDINTGDRLSIRPSLPPGDTGAVRFDWVSPMVASRHTRGTVYVGGNRLFTSRDHGESWTATKDLTRQVRRDTTRIMGVLNTDIRISRNDGEGNFSELTTISESPVDPRVLWVGADDGTVQVTRDGGATWTDVTRNFEVPRTSTIPGVPAGTFVSRVVASSSGRGVAYASFDGHRSGHFEPYVMRTTDFGATWTKVTTGLPSGDVVRTIHEYPGRGGLLFAGTERAIYVTLDSARSWTRIKANLPTVPTYDILVHPRTKDLILGTHGRSIWILDDAAPIAAWNSTIASRPAHLFPIRPVTQHLFWEDFSNWAQGEYAGDNPPDGALFSYSLARAVPNVTITVTAPDGRLVRTLEGPGEAGAIHRVNWDLRHEVLSAPGFVMPAVASEGRAGRGGGRGGRGGGRGGFAGVNPGMIPQGRGGPTYEPGVPRSVGARGAFVAPGTYTVTLQAGEQRVRETVRVIGDPALPLTVAQHREREGFQLQLADMLTEMVTMSQELANLRRDFTARRDAAAAGSPARAAADSSLERLTNVERSFVSGPVSMQGRINQLNGAFNGSGAQQGTFHPPTPPMKAQAQELRAAMDRVKAELAVVSRRR